MSPFLRGFTGELIKVGSPLGAILGGLGGAGLGLTSGGMIGLGHGVSQADKRYPLRINPFRLDKDPTGLLAAQLVAKRGAQAALLGALLGGVGGGVIGHKLTKAETEK